MLVLVGVVDNNNNHHWYIASVDCISTVRNSFPLIIAYNRKGSFRPSAAALGQLLCKIYSREDGSNMKEHTFKTSISVILNNT